MCVRGGVGSAKSGGVQLVVVHLRVCFVYVCVCIILSMCMHPHTYRRCTHRACGCALACMCGGVCERE